MEEARIWLASQFSGVPSRFDIDVNAAARDALEARLLDLEERELLVEDPIASDDWREAGVMVVLKRPPSAPGNQQLKDSLLWQSLLRLGATQPCVLVSNDKGFFDKSSTNLEATLAAEAADAGVDVTAVRSLTEILGRFRALVGSPESSVEDNWELISEKFEEDVSDLVGDEGWVLYGTPILNHSVFATEEPGQVALAIDLECEIGRKNEDEFIATTYVLVRGSALFDLRTEALDIDIERADISILTDHGDVNRSLFHSGRAATELRLKFGS
jgi:hypothetical protein